MLVALMVWRGLLSPMSHGDIASARGPVPVCGLLDHDDRLVQTFGFSILAAFFGALLITAIAAPRGSLMGRFFTSTSLRFLGKYAYGLYVFHFPLLFMFGQLDLVGRLTHVVHWRGLALLCQILIGLTISIATALASYHLYEKHFLKLKDFFEYQRPSGAQA